MTDGSWERLVEGRELENNKTTTTIEQQQNTTTKRHVCITQAFVPLSWIDPVLYYIACSTRLIQFFTEHSALRCDITFPPCWLV